jgi:hypothetical protein
MINIFLRLNDSSIASNESKSIGFQSSWVSLSVLASGDSTVVEHSPHHPKVKGLSLSFVVGIVKDK